MSSIFTPSFLQEPPKVPPRKPRPKVPPTPPLKAAVVKPTLTPPQGPPVPALQAIGFHGGLGDLAVRVDKVVTDHMAAHGFVPKPDEILRLALEPPTETHHVLPAPKPDALTLSDPDKLLKGLVGNAKAGGYQGFMERHGAQIDDLLRNPATKAKAAAAVAQARDIAKLNRRQEAGGTPGELFAAAISPVKLSAKLAYGFGTGQIQKAFVEDSADLGTWASTGGKKGSASFGNLEKTAPAVAQVVKGLVYSPVGLALTADAIAKDLNAAGGGSVRNPREPDFSFKHSRKVAASLGETFWQDITNPVDRAGYLFLDALGFASLGAGSVARMGAVGKAGVRAPHPTRSFTLTKDGFDAQIRLAQNPLMRVAQERWLELAQTKLDRTAKHTDIHGNPVELANPIARLFPDGSYGNRAAVWASNHNPLAPEKIIGRAENIQQQNELKSLSALNVLLHDTAGSSARRTWLSKVLPDRAYGGLSAGEMIAMESLSYDVSEGLSRLGMLERNAQTALELGIGEPKYWRQRLAQIALARKEKVFEKPRKQFLEAVVATQKVTAEQEALKIGGIGDRRLNGQTAENRVIKAGAIQEHFPVVAPMIDAHIKADAALKRAKDTSDGSPEAKQRIADAEQELADNPYPFVDLDDGGIGMRVGDTVVPLNRNSPDSWWFKATPKDKPTPRIGQGTARVGTSGLSPQLAPSELRYGFSGSSLVYGDHRIDLHNLAGESLAKAARTFVQWAVWKKAWENAGEHQPGYIPVRDVHNMPDDLRRALAEFDDERIDARSVDSLPDDLYRALFPKESEMVAGEHYRWIDPRLLGNAAKRPMPTGTVVDAFAKMNDVLRPLIFYTSPKYALNAVGNAGMLVIDQGFGRSYVNLLKAMGIDKALSPEDFARVKSHVGGGRSESYVSDKSGKVNRAFAEFWGKLTDERFRYASWIHHASVKGYKTPEDWHRLLNDADAKNDLLDVNRRANEALVAFDRMSPAERAVLRNFIFVYPWQRGAFLWSFRTVFEHPAKTALLATLGQDAYQNEPWLEHAAAWVRRTGFIPLGWNDDKTKLHTWNPISVNTFGTWNDVMQVMNAATRGDRYAAMGDMLGPPAQLLAHVALGIDENGRRYEGPQLEAAWKRALTVVPAVAAWEAAHRDQGDPVSPIDIRNRDALIKREHEYLDQAATSPGWLGGFGRLITGPDAWLNMPKQVASYWRDASPADRHRHEQDLIGRMVTRQGVFLDRKVPAEVRSAVKDMGGYAWFVKKQLEETNQDTPTRKQKLVWLIDYYQQAGKYDATTGDALRAKAEGTASQDLSSEAARLAVKYGNAAALGEWQHDVGRVANAVDNFDYRIAQLNRIGLSKQRVIRLPNDQRLEYAREYLAYKKGREALQDRKATSEELRLYDDSYDAPVKAKGGQVLPSPVRFAFSEGTTNDMTGRQAALVNHTWNGLSRAEKAAMGRDVDNDVSVGWGFYNALVKAVRERDGSVSRDQKADIAKLTGRKYEGFTQDWLYARRSRVERFMLSPLYADLPDRDVFTEAVLNPARQIVAAAVKAEEDGVSKAQANAKDVWEAYLKTKVLPWLRSRPALARELKAFGESFLPGLVARGRA